MLSNIIILIPLLLVVTYLGFYLRNLLMKNSDSPPSTILLIENQTIFSEEVDINPNQIVVEEQKKVSINKSISRGFGKLKFPVLIVAYLSLLLGMLSIIVYRDLKKQGFIDVSKFRVDIFLSVLVSPIVFQGMLGNYPDIHKLRWYYLLLNGYQSGFFWQTIFGEIAAKL